eukprot:Amastigsp_a683194_5.p3 type:complete len:223 gc:universal Amastigsp_a683194_5:697-29(-)
MSYNSTTTRSGSWSRTGSGHSTRSSSPSMLRARRVNGRTASSAHRAETLQNEPPRRRCHVTSAAKTCCPGASAFVPTRHVGRRGNALNHDVVAAVKLLRRVTSKTSITPSMGARCVTAATWSGSPHSSTRNTSARPSPSCSAKAIVCSRAKPLPPSTGSSSSSGLLAAEQSQVFPTLGSPATTMRNMAAMANPVPRRPLERTPFREQRSLKALRTWNKCRCP